MRTFLTILSLLFCSTAFNQSFQLSGRITNDRLEPIAFASIEVKDSKIGTTSKEDGSYKLVLEEGKYDLVVSMVGYKPQLISLVVNKNTVQNFLLENDIAKNLQEVQVQGRSRDRAEQIIKNVIRQKETILDQSGAYSCNIYIKAIQQNSSSFKPKNNKPLPDSIQRKLQAELANMSMAEILLKLDHGSSQKIKEERIGVKKNGNAESLFFLSTTEGDFNLYNNLLKLPGLSVVPFLSPISYSGLLAYKFKTINIHKNGNKKIYIISFKPRSTANAVIEGVIEIADSSWLILSSHFSLPKQHTPEYDEFETEQEYSYVNDSAWMISKQIFTYGSKFGKSKSSGSTIALYDSFVLNKIFPRNYFGNELSSTAEAAYEKDSSFWDKARAVPLTAKEIAFIHYKDSVYRVTHSKQYLDSIDKKTNRITIKKLFLDGITLYNRAKERTIFLDAIPSIYTPVEFGGARIGYDASLFKTYKSRKNIWVSADFDYGLRNKDLKGEFFINRMYNPFNRGFYHFEAGRSFANIYENDSYINVLKRSNVYEHDNFKISHGLELFNGLFLTNELEFAMRRSVAGYKVNPDLDSSFIGNILTNNNAVDFKAYNAFYNSITLAYTPQQRYIREPKEKIILGSHFPTFYTTWRKGVPGVFKSAIDFDYLEFGMKQTIKLGVAGISHYTVISGSFINKKNIQLVDYKFQRRGDPYVFNSPERAFQMLDSTFPVFKRFYEGHYIHEFNGFLLSKLPFIQKLKLLEVAGGGFLITNERHLRYFEVFAGLEKIMRIARDKYKIGVYAAGSVANKFSSPVQIKIGFQKFNKRTNSW